MLTYQPNLLVEMSSCVALSGLGCSSCIQVGVSQPPQPPPLPHAPSTPTHPSRPMKSNTNCSWCSFDDSNALSTSGSCHDTESRGLCHMTWHSTSVRDPARLSSEHCATIPNRIPLCSALLARISQSRRARLPRPIRMVVAGAQTRGQQLPSPLELLCS